MRYQVEQKVKKFLQDRGLAVKKTKWIDLGDSKVLEVYVPSELYPNPQEAIKLSYTMFEKGLYPEEVSVFIHPASQGATLDSNHRRR